MEPPDVEHLAHKVPWGEKISPEELSSSCQCWPVSKEVLKAQVRVDFSLGAVDLQVVC